MKNRIWKKVTGLGFFTLFLAASIWSGAGKTLQVRAEDMNETMPVLKVSACWTDPENYCGEILMEVGNLRKYVEKYTRQMEPVVENPSQEAAEPDREEIAVQDSFPNGSFQWDDLTENIPYAEIITEGTETEDVRVHEIPTGDGDAEGESVWKDGNQSEDILEDGMYSEDFLRDGDLPEDISDRKNGNERYEEDPQDISAGIQGVENADLFLTQETFSSERTQFPQLFLINYISEYFQLNTTDVPQGCIIEEIPVRNQKGEDIHITKVTYPINISENTQDIISLSLPVILREEYRINVMETFYPVSQDEPLNKDRAGTGAFVLEKYEGTDNTAAAFLSPELSVKASVCDYLAELKADVSETKAGEVINYVLDIQNTGALPLADISVKSEFSLDDIKAVWEFSENAQVNGKDAVISYLKAGESCKLYMTVKLTENQSGQLKNHVVLRAKHPGTGGELIRETADNTTVTPLTADFTVEKTADRTVAAPGDTVTYQICIRNTGEKTLHSVISTERFLNAGIQAQFVQKEGVVLNSTRTQALISSIAPGEAFALLATVTIPQYFASQELVNEVIVKSEETGIRQLQAQSKITLTALQTAATITPLASSQGYYQGGYSAKSAYDVSSKPKTGDTTPVVFYTALLAASILLSRGIFVHRKRKSRVSKRNEKAM